MKIDIGFQPNCSETVFRVSRSEIDELTPETKEAFWTAARAGVTEEDVKANMFAILGLPNLRSAGGYSTLVPEEEDQFCLYYYQNHLKKWAAELPFNTTDGSDGKPKVPDRHVWPDHGDELASGGIKNSLPSEYSGIIELRRLAREHKEGQA